MGRQKCMMRAFFLGCVFVCEVTAVEVAAQHGPDPQTIFAFVLGTKNACDEAIPGYAEKYKEQHERWVARNGELIRAFTSGQYDGKTFGQFTEYVKAEFRKQSPADQQKRCNQIVALYTAHLAKRVFVMESLDRLAPWTSRSFNGVSNEGIDIWFVPAKDWNENLIEGRPFPVIVCIGTKSFSKEELLTIRLEETELDMGGSQHRGKIRSTGPIYRWLRDSDDAEIVGPSQDASLKKGHYRCYEIVFDEQTPTTNIKFRILLRGIRGSRGSILVPPVSFIVKEQP